MSQFLTLTINGIALAALFFMVASGLSLIFGLMGVLNFAHGAFFAWGAYIFLELFNRTGNFWMALAGATAAGAAAGALTERIFIRTLYQRPLSQILVTLGLGLVLNQAIVAVWGQNALLTPNVPGLSSQLVWGGVTVNSYQLFVIGIGAAILLAVWTLLRFTRIGLIVRAGVENPVMVGALGVNVGLVFLGIFALGTALATLGGAVYAPFLGNVSPGMGQTMLLSAIIVVVLGGLGSYVGSAVGALVIGLAQEYVPYYALQAQSNGWIPEGLYSSAASLASLILLVAILLLRPRGLMGLKLEGGER